MVEMILISHKYKIVFIYTPKCGCTTIKTLYFLMENIKIDKSISIHRDQTKRKYIISDQILKDKKYDKYTKYFVTRDPYERLKSAYYQKIANKSMLHYDRSLSKEECILNLNNGNLSMSEFVDVIMKSKPGNLDDHFKPQILDREFVLKQSNVILYDISKLDDLPGIINAEHNLNLDVTNYKQNKRQNKCHNISNEHNIRKKVHQFYRMDYDLLNYI